MPKIRSKIIPRTKKNQHEKYHPNSQTRRQHSRFLSVTTINAARSLILATNSRWDEDPNRPDLASDEASTSANKTSRINTSGIKLRQKWTKIEEEFDLWSRICAGKLSWYDKFWEEQERDVCCFVFIFWGQRIYICVL